MPPLAERRVDHVNMCGRRTSANIVDIDGLRFLVGSKSEDNAPISHPSPIRSLVTAAQHRDIAGERIFFHFEECRVNSATLAGRDSTTCSLRSIA
jgi:hypothetical protein